MHSRTVGLSFPGAALVARCQNDSVAGSTHALLTDSVGDLSVWKPLPAQKGMHDRARATNFLQPSSKERTENSK